MQMDVVKVFGGVLQKFILVSKLDSYNRFSWLLKHMYGQRNEVLTYLFIYSFPNSSLANDFTYA